MTGYHICVIIGLMIGLISGWACVQQPISDKLRQCERERNVFECTMVAVPVSMPVWTNKPKAEVL